MVKEALQGRVPEQFLERLQPLWRRWKHRPAFLRRTAVDRPIFVVGHPRSGTSWLYKLLVNHPALAGGPETHLFDYYLKPFLGTDPFVPWGGINQWMGTKEQAAVLRRLVDGVFTHRLAEEQKRRVVEKTPEHALFIEPIKALYPRAKFVHIVRDGRDVMLSVFAYASNLPDPPASVEAAAEQWAQTLDAVQTMQQRFPSDILTVRYEDLVASTQTFVARIFDFIGEPCSETSVRRIVEEFPPSAKSVGKWRKQLSPGDAAAFERTAGAWLRDHDYEVRESGPGRAVTAPPAS